MQRVGTVFEAVVVGAFLSAIAGAIGFLIAFEVVQEPIGFLPVGPELAVLIGAVFGVVQGVVLGVVIGLGRPAPRWGAGIGLLISVLPIPIFAETPTFIFWLCLNLLVSSGIGYVVALMVDKSIA